MASSTRPHRPHPLCAALFNVCERGPQWFELALWAEWLSLLAFWLVMFVLIMHCGARKIPTQNSRCIVDRYCCQV
jgi:hypothetical protein